MNEKIREIEELLDGTAPVTWSQIPDIDLYMDQVLSFISRHYYDSNGKDSLTSSMVNNYAKQGLLPRAHGKKYNRNHIATLTVICLLKQVLSVSDSKILLDALTSNTETEQFYSRYNSVLHEKIDEIKEYISISNNDKLENLALEMAINSYLYKLVCQSIIDKIKPTGENK